MKDKQENTNRKTNGSEDKITSIKNNSEILLENKSIPKSNHGSVQLELDKIKDLTSFIRIVINFSSSLAQRTLGSIRCN